MKLTPLKLSSFNIILEGLWTLHIVSCFIIITSALFERPFVVALITVNLFSYDRRFFYWQLRDRALWPQGENWIRIFLSKRQNAKYKYSGHAAFYTVIVACHIME